VAQISALLGCSENKINYWLAKYGIAKRTISEAIYGQKNPAGDPFVYSESKSIEDGILFGLGIGLYWGEGSKKGTGGVKLANSDPRLIQKFIEFLQKCFSIDKNKIRFSLHLFNDISSKRALDYWIEKLRVKKSQFYKIVVSPPRGTGTYRHKSEYGVILLQFNNIKLKRILCTMIEKIE